MSKVHYRHASVFWVGQTRTGCGRTLYSIPTDMALPVLNFGGYKVTTDEELVTCVKCNKRNG